MKITEHIPSFVDIDEEDIETVEFTNLEDLLNIPFVSRQKNYKGFEKFEISDRLLIAYFTNEFWVIGHLDVTKKELKELKNELDSRRSFC